MTQSTKDHPAILEERAAHEATIARLQRELAEAREDWSNAMALFHEADKKLRQGKAEQAALIGAGFSLGVRAAEKLYVNHGLDFDASLADQMLSLALDSKADATAALATVRAEARKEGMLAAAGIDWSAGRDATDSAPDYLTDWQRGFVSGQQAMRDAIIAAAEKGPST